MITPQYYGDPSFFINVHKAATTVANPWFPAYVLGHLNFSVGSRFIENHVLYYALLPKPYTSVSYFSDLIDNFNTSLKVTSYYFKTQGERYGIYVSKGIISDDSGNILALFCINTLKCIEEVNPFEQSYIPGTTKLFVASEFIIEDKYKNVYKSFFKETITDCLTHDIPVEYMSSKKIFETCYNEGFELKLDSISEVDDHLQNEVHKIYFQNVEDLVLREEQNNGEEIPLPF